MNITDIVFDILPLFLTFKTEYIVYINVNKINQYMFNIAQMCSSFRNLSILNATL